MIMLSVFLGLVTRWLLSGAAQLSGPLNYKVVLFHCQAAGLTSGIGLSLWLGSILLYRAWFVALGRSREGWWILHLLLHPLWSFSEFYSSTVRHIHLRFLVSVRLSFVRILRQVCWWWVTMVTKYDVMGSKWSSNFWVKMHVFHLVSTIKAKPVDKMKESTYLCVISHVKHEKIAKTFLRFYLISCSG